MYVDDLLLAATTNEECLRATNLILQLLYASGFKVSREKLQVSRPSVTFMGRLITAHSVISFVNMAAFTFSPLRQWKLAKICAQTKLTWLSVLPLILMFVRSSVNRISGFTPFELLTGRSFPGPSTPLKPDQITPLSHCVYFDKLTALIKIFPAGHCRQWSQMDWAPESHLKNIALCSPSRKRRHLVSFVCLYFMWPP